MLVGQRIKEYIQDAGLSNSSIASNARISLLKFNMAISGERKLTFKEYESICWVLGVNVDKFITPKIPFDLEKNGGDTGTKRNVL